VILDVDLSQIEWRIVAELTQDPVMIQEILKRIDQHAATCTSVDMMNMPLTKENRNNAKIFNFRAIYAKPETAAYAYYMDEKLPNFAKKKWETIMQGFFSKYSGMGTAHRAWIEEVRETGRLVGPTGRIWNFQKHRMRDGSEDYKVTQIRNYPVQGTAGDVIKMALVQIRKRLLKDYPHALMCMTVHDSIIFDLQSDYEEIARICIEVFNQIPELMHRYFNWEMTVPIDGEAELGINWASTKEITI
jgi:DNA polymerase-1